MQPIHAQPPHRESRQLNVSAPTSPKPYRPFPSLKGIPISLLALTIPLLAITARAEEPVTAPEIAVQLPNATHLIDGDATVNFESPKVGSAGVTRSLTIRNTGNATLSGLALTVDGEHASDFTVSALEVSTVAPGASRTFTVTFRPGAVGPRSAALHIASNDADENPFDIRLTGTGAAPEVTAPEIAVQLPNGTNLIDGDATVNFESPKVGSAGVTRSLTIRNTGNATLSGLALTVDGENAADFTVSALEVSTVAPGASRTFTVTFRPGAVGPRRAALHIASNDADEPPFDIRLTGTGVEAPEIGVHVGGDEPLKDEKAFIDFGTVSSRSDRKVKIFTISNCGNARLTGLSLRKNGINRGDFTISRLNASSLNPDKSISFKVRFTPSGKGNRWAAVHIGSNDPSTPSFDIVLTGKCPSAALAKSSTDRKPAASVTQAPTRNRPVVSTLLVDGRKYRCITIRKTAGVALDPRTVEVSADLVHWSSGPRHTTVVENSASVLRVRDTTPLTRETKRYIRIRKSA